MNKPKTRLTDEQKADAVTRGQGGAATPDVIPLTESQCCAIQALANDEANLITELRRVEGILKQVQARREKVFAEFSNLTVAEIISSYRFDGERLVKKAE